MKINLSSRLAPIALTALLCAPAAAFAQSTTTAPSTPPAAPAPGAGPQTAAPSATPQSAAQRVEQRIQQLHSELRITQAEQSQWQKFADVMRANARDMDTALQQREQRFDKMNAVDNLKSYQDLAEKHAQHLKKLASAFDDLYSKLSPDQKKLADNEFRAKAQARAEEHEQRMQSGSSSEPRTMPSTRPQH